MPKLSSWFTEQAIFARGNVSPFNPLISEPYNKSSKALKCLQTLGEIIVALFIKTILNG